MAVSGRALANDMLMLAVLGLLTVAVGWRWASTRPWLERRNDPRQGRWERPVAIGICALSLPMLTYMIPLT
jgi:hypothetical protein